MLKPRVALLQTSPEIPLHQLICRILFSLTTYQHSRSQGRSNLNQPCLRRFWNETSKLLQPQLEMWFEAGFHHPHLPWVLLYPEKSEWFHGTEEQSTDLIPWDGVMGQGKHPGHCWTSNLGVNSKHHGESGVQTPKMRTGMDTRAAHGYQHCTCAIGRGKEANTPRPPHPSPPQNRGHAAAAAGEGCKKKPDTRFGVSYLRPAVGKEGGTQLSLLTQVLTCLNIVSASLKKK